MPEALKEIIRQNRAGAPVAIPSVCSAQPDVLRASLRLAERLDRSIVIEATSNQVNQDGGYTGLTPEGFVAFVYGLADQAGAAPERIILGGDHLGPQAWRKLAPDQAMDKARHLVRDYVAAGFGKIHLDCSEGCLGEPAQLDDGATAERSAVLAWEGLTATRDVMFVVGTEVPPPGGARADEDGDIPPTSAQSARATLAAHDACFGEMAELIGGLVVQPGVEFSPTQVHHLPLERDPGLLAALADHPGICLEAHSTDYQHASVFPRLAELGFAFQKVGPALTFAYREALYGLDRLRAPSGALKEQMEALMVADPSYWQGHYHGDAEALYHQRHDGLADRIRYYWPQPAAQAAVAALLEAAPDVIPDAALRTVFDDAVLARAEALSGPIAQRLIDAKIEMALAPYFFEVTE